MRAFSLRSLLILTVLASASFAQSALQIRHFDAASLATKPFRGQSFYRSLPLSSAYGYPHSEMETDPQSFIEPDQILDLIRMTIEPSSWDEIEGVELSLDNRQIIARHRPETLDKIGALLAGIGDAIARPGVVEIFAVDRSALVSGKHALSRAEASALVGSDKARSLGFIRVRSGEIRRFLTGSEQSFIADYDVEVAQKSTIADPIVRSLRDGMDLRIRLCATPTGEAFVEASAVAATLNGMNDRSVAAPDRPLLQLPSTESEVAFSSAVLENGGVMIMGSGASANTMYALRVQIGDAPQTNIPNTRVIQLGALCAPVNDAGPLRLGRPMLAAHTDFDSENPEDVHEHYSLIEADRLVDILSNGVNKDFHDNEHNGMWVINHSALIVWSRDSDTLRKTQEYIAGLHAQRARSISLELRYGLVESLKTSRGNSTLADLAGKLSGSLHGCSVAQRRIRLLSGSEQGLVRDFDVEIAQESTAFDPIIATIFDGAALKAELTMLEGGSIGLKGLFGFQSVAAPMKQVRLGHSTAESIDLPRAEETEVDIRASLSDSKWMLVEAVPMKGKTFVVMVRAQR